MKRELAFVLWVHLLATTAACGDTIWLNPGGAGGAASALKIEGLKISDVAHGRIQFVAAGGRESAREIQQVARIQIDDEPAFSAAEEAFAMGDFDAATNAYRKALDTTQKDWLKQWSAARLVQAAPRANRFDAAVAGYITLVLINPEEAAAHKPRMPDARSTYLATAIDAVNAALARAGINDAQRQALQKYLLELQAARGNEAAAAQTKEQLLQAAATNGNDAAANAELAQLRLQANARLLAEKQFDAVIADIDTNAALFITPTEQATALYYLAEARAGLAARDNAPAAWQDAALAYMRVVAHFKNSPAAPFVARSLLKAGEIAEKLEDHPAALSLYRQILQQYPTDSAASTARAALERLKAKP